MFVELRTASRGSMQSPPPFRRMLFPVDRLVVRETTVERFGAEVLISADAGLVVWVGTEETYAEIVELLVRLGRPTFSANGFDDVDEFAGRDEAAACDGLGHGAGPTPAIR